MPQHVLRIFRVHLPKHGQDLLFVHRVIKQDHVMANSSLGGILIVVLHFLIDSNYGQTPVTTVVRKQFVDSGIFRSR